MKYTFAVICFLGLLSGCSSITLGYQFADNFLEYTIDSWFDLNDSQEEYAANRIENIIAWHRTRELPQIIALLHDVNESVSDGHISDNEWDHASQLFNERRTRLFTRVGNEMIEFISQLEDEQINYFEEELQDRREEKQEEILPTQEEREAERLDEITDDLEDFFGSLTDKQIAFLKTTITLDDEEIKRRQSRTMATNNYVLNLLRNWRADKEHLRNELSKFLEQGDFYHTEEHKSSEQFREKIEVNTRYFVSTLNQQQLDNFKSKLNEMITDLQAIAEKT